MDMFDNATKSSSTALQTFEPDASSVYPIEMAATLARVTRRHIVVYFKYGLVAPVIDPACGGWWFSDRAIRVLRRIEYLRSDCGINLAGIKFIMDLTKEVELLRQKIRVYNRQ
jgi:MerR family transcriptional regulator, heat shock protein HspR